MDTMREIIVGINTGLSIAEVHFGDLKTALEGQPQQDEARCAAHGLVTALEGATAEAIRMRDELIERTGRKGGC